MFLCVPYTYTLMLFLFYLKAAVCLVFCVLLLNREISHLGSNDLYVGYVPRKPTVASAAEASPLGKDQAGGAHSRESSLTSLEGSPNRALMVISNLINYLVN
jgi:hypothetical protein